METITEGSLQSKLEDRRRRLRTAIASRTADGSLTALLHEVDAALQRICDGSFGICEECHETVEEERSSRTRWCGCASITSMRSSDAHWSRTSSLPPACSAHCCRRTMSTRAAGVFTIAMNLRES